MVRVPFVLAHRAASEGPGYPLLRDPSLPEMQWVLGNG